MKSPAAGRRKQPFYLSLSWTSRNIAREKELNFSENVLLPLPPLISPFSLHDKRNQWATIISVFELKAWNGVNLYFFMNYFYRVRLMAGIVQCLLKSEVVEEDLSIWSNIELVWMESQMIFTNSVIVATKLSVY